MDPQDDHDNIMSKIIENVVLMDTDDMTTESLWQKIAQLFPSNDGPRIFMKTIDKPYKLRNRFFNFPEELETFDYIAKLSPKQHTFFMILLQLVSSIKPGYMIKRFPVFSVDGTPYCEMNAVQTWPHRVTYSLYGYSCDYAFISEEDMGNIKSITISSNEHIISEYNAEHIPILRKIFEIKEKGVVPLLLDKDINPVHCDSVLVALEYKECSPEPKLYAKKRPRDSEKSILKQDRYDITRILKHPTTNVVSVLRKREDDTNSHEGNIPYKYIEDTDEWLIYTVVDPLEKEAVPFPTVYFGYKLKGDLFISIEKFSEVGGKMMSVHPLWA